MNGPNGLPNGPNEPNGPMDATGEMTWLGEDDISMSNCLWPWAGPAVSPDGSPDWVEYIGRTALVVTGPYTGARYRFCQPGARLSVDARDRQALLSIPMLRAVVG